MELKQPKTLVIDRNQWIRGEGNLPSYLLRSYDGKMCCLGFYALECGMSKDDIANEKTPFDVYNHIGVKLPGLFEEGRVTSNTISGCLMDTNDVATKFESEEEREAFIADYFKQIGTEVTFIN